MVTLAAAQMDGGILTVVACYLMVTYAQIGEHSLGRQVGIPRIDLFS